MNNSISQIIQEQNDVQNRLSMKFLQGAPPTLSTPMQYQNHENYKPLSQN